MSLTTPVHCSTIFEPISFHGLMIVKVALPLILAFIMFSLGLGLRKQDFTRVLKYPRAFATGVINQLILLPLIAFGLAEAFDFPPELAVGVMILSLCPGGVTSSVLSRIGKGNTPLSISLTATAPNFVEKIAGGVSRTAIVLFVLIVAAALANNWVVFFLLSALDTHRAAMKGVQLKSSTGTAVSSPRGRALMSETQNLSFCHK